MRQPLLSLRTKVENVMEIIEKEASELEESIDMRKVFSDDIGSQIVL